MQDVVLASLKGCGCGRGRLYRPGEHSVCIDVLGPRRASHRIVESVRKEGRYDPFSEQYASLRRRGHSASPLAAQTYVKPVIRSRLGAGVAKVSRGRDRLKLLVCRSYARQSCFLNETDRPEQLDRILLLSLFRLKDGATMAVRPFSSATISPRANLAISTET